MRILGGVAVLLLAGTVQACGGGSGPSPQQDPGADATSAPTAVWTESAVEDRCLSNTPDAPVTPVRITAPGVAVDAGTVAPEGEPDLGVAMLPQVSGGLCGGLRFAAHLADSGVLVASMDACGYDDSDCATGPDVEASQVDAAVAHLREESGNPDLPVVLVGASMGGSLAVRAVAQGADVVGYVDLSGPVSWEGRSLTDLAGSVPPGGLVVHSPRDGEREFQQNQRLARRLEATFLRAPHGHGWEMLRNLEGQPNRLADRVRDHILTAARG